MSDKTFRQAIEHLIKVEHDEITDDECVDRICEAVTRCFIEELPDEIYYGTVDNFLNFIRNQIKEAGKKGK